MKGSFSILFYPKGSKKDKQGNTLIFARITVDGKRSELSIKRRINLSRWDSSVGKAIGRNHEELELNRYIANIRSEIYKIHEKLVTKGKPFTSLMIKNIYLNKNENHRTLLIIFEEHNIQMKSLVGKDYSSGCYKRYERTKNHIAEYIKTEYNVNDIFLNEIDLKFINGFEYFLKIKDIGNQNTITKYVTNFKKIIRIAYAHNWIKNDPFFHWKATWKTVEREFLNEHEIQLLLDKKISTPRLDQVRDIFLFSCFTGLAYVDVKKLSKNDIVTSVDNEKWIQTKRTKTDTRISLPLLPVAESIIEKYKDYQLTSINEKLLPVISNQKMNGYLKEIADICGIPKNLTFHLARHTFATTVTLSNGVPIESVSKMLGHKSLKTTQIYAKVLDNKVRNDMKVIKNKFSSNKETKKVDKLKIVSDKS